VRPGAAARKEGKGPVSWFSSAATKVTPMPSSGKSPVKPFMEKST
jgi:hypothetical protein